MTEPDILAKLRAVERLRGDTYSSMEVIDMVGKAADEIERLQAAKRRALAIADERAKENVRLKAKLRELGHDER